MIYSLPAPIASRHLYTAAAAHIRVSLSGKEGTMAYGNEGIQNIAASHRGNTYHHSRKKPATSQRSYRLLSLFNVPTYRNCIPLSNYHIHLDYQHRISIAEETIFVFDGFFIRFHCQVVTGKSTNHDQQTGFRQVQIGNQ